MKKSIKDLTEKDVIATPTIEDWQEVKKLFPKIDMSDSRWDVYKEEACIRPLGRDGRGQYAPLSYYQSEGIPIHSLTDFIEYEPLTPIFTQQFIKKLIIKRNGRF